MTIKTIRGLVADMDGVLWRDKMSLPGVAAFFQAVQIPYVFATNNSSRTIDYYMDKLAQFDIPAQPHQIITSGVATAAYLAEKYPQGTTTFVVGGLGLRTAMLDQGFRVVEDEQPALVVAGLDFDITYEKLKKAVLYIRAGAAFYGTNADRTYPVANGLAPGAGSILAALETGTDVVPTVIGKPARPMFEIALRRLKTQPEETLMIGDRLETDIWGAHEVGMKTALVLTGVSQEADIIKSEIKPAFVYKDMTALLADYQG